MRAAVAQEPDPAEASEGAAAEPQATTTATHAANREYRPIRRMIHAPVRTTMIPTLWWTVVRNGPPGQALIGLL